MNRDHVVAVHAHVLHADAVGALRERHLGLARGGLGDRELVVLHEEHDGRGVDGREDERLVDVALAGGAVAEVADHRAVLVGLARADQAVPVHRLGVADGVQRVGADDERVEVEVVRGGVPRAVLVAAEGPQDLRQVDAAHEGDAVLAVAGEHVVRVAQHARRADLGGLLAERRDPQAQFALTLQAGGLVVEGARDHHVAPELAQVVGGDVLGVGANFAFLTLLPLRSRRRTSPSSDSGPMPAIRTPLRSQS